MQRRILRLTSPIEVGFIRLPHRSIICPTRVDPSWGGEVELQSNSGEGLRSALQPPTPPTAPHRRRAPTRPLGRGEELRLWKIRISTSGGVGELSLGLFRGGLGAALRHLINLICARLLGTGFPWGTFIINITGSTVMGLIAEICLQGRGVAAMAAVPGLSRRLHHVFRLLARYGAARRAGRIGPRGGLRAPARSCCRLPVSFAGLAPVQQHELSQ